MDFGLLDTMLKLSITLHIEKCTLNSLMLGKHKFNMYRVTAEYHYGNKSYQLFFLIFTQITSW